MASRYLLESSSTDGYLLEDGSGVLLLDEPATDWADDFSGDLSNWVATANAYSIVSNQLAGPPGIGAMRYSQPVASGTQFSQFTFKGGSGHGVAVAMTGFSAGAAYAAGGGTFYTYRQGVGGGDVVSRIVQKDSGSTGTTTIIDNGPNLTDGDVIRLEYDGTTVTAFVNGVQVLQASPGSPISGNQYVGVASTSANSGTAIADDWSGGMGSILTPTNIGVFGVPIG